MTGRLWPSSWALRRPNPPRPRKRRVHKAVGTTRVLRARQLSLHQLAVKSPPAGGECAPGCRYQSKHRRLVPLQESA
jgi:hypothetical protein